MLTDNETVIYINNNNLLIPKKDYFELYCYLYDEKRKKFVFILVDEVKTLSEGYKYKTKWNELQFTEKEFKEGLIL
jgi:hypothetical protein